jgi:hypothetical protein
MGKIGWSAAGTAAVVAGVALLAFAAVGSDGAGTAYGGEETGTAVSGTPDNGTTPGAGTPTAGTTTTAGSPTTAAGTPAGGAATPTRTAGGLPSTGSGPGGGGIDMMVWLGITGALLVAAGGAAVAGGISRRD